ncbi:GntR family transcriptional regulator [Pandoraea anhela]|uniref:GntR family transcriptional regulator n=2 Tax=Pandoraea anhela TaxID=2508295 RepID=A0A5E4WDM0_9BURK|nr:GntR family transcriptional regulator [Pandoraea anhela]
MSEASIAERIQSAIRDDIIAGELVPGTPLIEVDLATRFGVSRNSLREAFRLLCRDGLAVHQRHRGVTVRTLTRADVRDIFRARRTLELSALARTEPIDTERLAAMEQRIVAQEVAAAADRWRDVGTASLLFHQDLVRMHGSALLDDFFRNLMAQLRLLFLSALEERVIQKPWVPKDRALYELLKAARFDDATRKLTEYLSQSEHALLDYL